MPAIFMWPWCLDSTSLITDKHCGTQQVQIILKPLVSLYRRALKAILLKTTTLTIPLKERLNYNEGVLLHRILSGRAPLSLTTKISWNQSWHSGKLNIPIPTVNLFKSSLVEAALPSRLS